MADEPFYAPNCRTAVRQPSPAVLAPTDAPLEEAQCRPGVGHQLVNLLVILVATPVF